MSLIGSTNEEKIWNYLKAKGLPDCGIAGLMGNLYAESCLIPTNLQNSYEKVLAHHIFTNELGIPTCTIEKEYALGAVGQLRTRFQAFIESLEIKQIQGGK